MAANLFGLAFMPYYRHVMEILETDKNLKSTAKGIFHQVCYAAAGTAVGGVLGGPPGAMVGGVVGSYLGYSTVHNYDSMITVLRDMTDENKEKFVAAIQQLVGSTGIEALVGFLASQVNREVFLNLVKEFAKGVTKGG